MTFSKILCSNINVFDSFRYLRSGTMIKKIRHYATKPTDRWHCMSLYLHLELWLVLCSTLYFWFYVVSDSKWTTTLKKVQTVVRKLRANVHRRQRFQNIMSKFSNTNGYKQYAWTSTYKTDNHGLRAKVCIYNPRRCQNIHYKFPKITNIKRYSRKYYVMHEKH